MNRPEDEPREAVIEINGTILTQPQSLTVRVALEAFAMSLDTNGLGKDSLGKELVERYKAQIREIRKSLYKERLR